MKPRNDRQAVMEYAKIMGLDVCPPQKGSPGILITDWRTRPAKHIADALTWSEARAQIMEFARTLNQ